jgi:tetratricopeptide (TPR) repeat protein
MLKRALANRERHLPPDHLEVANSLEALADFYEPLSRYLDAEPLYFRALSIREKQLGPEHAKVASSLKESAWILMRLGRFREGIPLARRSVRIYESLGRDHEAELVWAYNALAGLVDDDKDYIEAESLYRKALAIVDRRGDDPESLGVLTHNLANCLTAQGRYIEARALYARAVEQVIAESSDRIQEFLRKAWNRANELNNLAGCEYVLGARDDARRNYDKALTLAEKDFGAEHYQVMRALRGLARLEQFHGKIADAEALLERAGKIAAARKAENPNDWASHEEQLAGLRQFQGRLKEARELFESARKTRAAAPGFSGDLEELDDSLAGLDLIEGKWPQSAARFERRIHALEKIRADHFGETFPLIELGLVYSMMGRFVPCVWRKPVSVPGIRACSRRPVLWPRSNYFQAASTKRPQPPTDRLPKRQSAAEPTACR